MDQTMTLETEQPTEPDVLPYTHFWRKFWLNMPPRDKVIAALGVLRWALRFYKFNSREPFIIERKVQILKWKGGRIEIGRGARLAMGSKIVCGGHLTIGPRTIIGANDVIMCATEVKIGARCMISWNCSIFDSIGHRMWLERSGEAEVEAPITIGDDV